MTADVPTADGPEPDAAPVERAERVPPTGSVLGQPDGPVGGAQNRLDDEGAKARTRPAAPLVIRKRGRRVTTDPVPGYTGGPEPEPQQPASENDARLKGDVPPHWG